MADAGRLDGTRTTRRGFFRLAGATTALSALAQLPGLTSMATAGSADPSPGEARTRFFSPRETEVLTQVVERMVDTGEANAPAVRETRAVDVIDRACGSLDPALTDLLPTLLRLVDWGPFLFDFQWKRFAVMNDAERDTSLACWMNSRLQTRRIAFMALRNLSMLGYYSQPETWPLIDYAGPLRTHPGPRP